MLLAKTRVFISSTKKFEKSNNNIAGNVLLNNRKGIYTAYRSDLN